MTPNTAEIVRALGEARAHVHPLRAMRVTLECGHYRLLAFIDTLIGIGAQTGCQVCSPESPGAITRLVVNVEETGVLHDSWHSRGGAA